MKSTENCDYEVSDGLFKWATPVLSEANPNSNIEIGFSSKVTPDDIFPFTVDFKADYNFYKLGVKTACTLSDSNSLAHEFL